jgi:hypothetical protein
MSLEKPINPADIQKWINNEMESDSAGYLEDDDGDSREILEFNYFFQNWKRKSDNNLFEEDNQNYQIMQSDQIGENNQNAQIKENLRYSDSVKNLNNEIIITTENQINQILTGKLKSTAQEKYVLKFLEQKIPDIENLNSSNQPEEINKIILIIQPDHLLIILEHLFKELDQGLMDLYDIFVIERRKYLDPSQRETYIQIIRMFINKKDDFFLSFLSNITTKLNIPEEVFNNTMNYYLNLADEDDEIVKRIREAFDKVYHAGLKP